MPNKRKAGLVLLSAWIDEDLSKRLEKLASSTGKTKTDIIRECVEHAIRECKKETDKATRFRTRRA
jgi:predicted DNA-binding protein